MRSILTAVFLMLPAFALAQDIQTYAKKAAFDDIRFELGQAVVARGYAPHSEGNLAKMLERTGAAVGSTKEVYRQAEFITFCSAKYTRALVEADPANMAHCPFIVFVYETPDKPGEIVAGYRRLGAGKTEAARKAIVDVETMLNEIVKDALK